ncbi:MAG: signal peptidase II [Alphaproteobacteria bacterium]|nr:signal peptidase II [Alphaproteobacteria bacterium]
MIKPCHKTLWLFIKPLVVLVSDFLTKLYIVTYVPYGQKMRVTDFFNIVHVKNLGVSFSMLTMNNTYGYLLLAALAGANMLMVVYILRKTPDDTLKCFLSLVLGGAMGNLFDRLYYGGVIDFLDFHVYGYHWPAFNVADCAIVLGVGLYCIRSIMLERKIRV